MLKMDSADLLLTWLNGGDNKGRCAGAGLSRLSKSHISKKNKKS